MNRRLKQNEYYAIVISRQNRFASGRDGGPYLTCRWAEAAQFADELRAHGLECRVRLVTVAISFSS